MITASEKGKHRRVNDILLGPLERPALEWFAVHLPAWITPDHCTLIGLSGSLMVMVFYALSAVDRNFLWLASLGLFVNWFGDSMDGTLARHRNIERPVFGFFVDHMADAASQVMMFLGVGLSPYVRFDIACLALTAYLLLSVLVYVRTYTSGVFKISYGKLGPTEFRALTILLNTAMFFTGRWEIVLPTGFFGSIALSQYDLVVSGIALLLLYFLVTTTVQESIRLSKDGR
jgi:archaetidylinositol phosphate synthase